MYYRGFSVKCVVGCAIEFFFGHTKTASYTHMISCSSQVGNLFTYG